MEYRWIEKEEVSRNLFREFRRYQNVTRCLRKVEGKWLVKDITFVDDWDEKELEELVEQLKDILADGGMVYGAWEGNLLKGFVAVAAGLFGSKMNYIDLVHIYVSEELRGRGTGTRLFEEAKTWARLQGAEKLYISAHSAVESQGFYKKRGCVEAEEYHAEHVEKEPCDCQLEYVL
jgi:GNAT superfamily N-acetyltransferase